MAEAGQIGSAKAYDELVNLLFTRLVVNAKVPDMTEICEKETTNAFRNKWLTGIAAIAFAQLAMASENSPKGKPLVERFGITMIKASPLEGPVALEVFNSAWNDFKQLLAGGNDLQWAQKWLRPVGYDTEGLFGPSFMFSQLVLAEIKQIRAVMDAAVQACEKY